MNTTKKIFTFLNVLIIAFVLSCTTFQYKVLAEKKSKQESTLILKARSGGNIVYGSVLNPKENELKAKLPKKILKGNTKEISITLTKLIKENESSNIYTLKPADSISVFGKLLVINVLASLTDVNGSIYTAGALPDGTYELTLRIGELTAKGKFEYKTPVLVVGNVTTKGGKCVGGTQQVNSLQGKSISNVVALTSNCLYFNEVQASRINDKQEQKKRKHLYQSTDTTGTEIPASSPNTIDTTNTTTEEAKEIAISEAIATTSDGGIEELTAAIELDPENNGEKRFDINENTTQITENAIDFIQGEEEVVSEEDLEFTEEILQGEVKATLIEEEVPEVKEEFVFDPTCTSKFTDLTNTISSTPTREELLDFGKRVIALIENGELKNCIPPFITKIIDKTKSKGDTGFISFAKKFIFHTKEIEGDLEGPNLNKICIQLKEGIKLFETCKGGFCPPPPCIHPNVRETLKETCPELLALVPTSKCEEGRGACEINGELNENIGASCIEFESADAPNLCEPCNSDADCFNPKEVPETNCTLAINVCRADILDYYGDPVGKIQHQGAKGICYFNGIPKNPFTCEELAFISDPQLVCLGPPGPPECTIGRTDLPVHGDRRCCKEKTPIDTKVKKPVYLCLIKKLCSDQDTYFAPGEFGRLFGLDEPYQKALDICIIKTNSIDISCYNNPCPDSPLECLEQIESVNCEDPKCNLGDCESGFIGLP